MEYLDCQEKHAQTIDLKKYIYKKKKNENSNKTCD